MTDLVNQYYEAFQTERKKVGTMDVPERWRFIREEVGRDRDVVELGCRFGALIEHFAEGNRVVGLDVDRRALEICRERLGVATHVANLNEPLPLANASFDVVVLSEVLEHLPYPQITLREIVRVLRNDGKLVGSVPNAVILRNRLRFMFRGVVELDPTHLHHFSQASLSRLMRTFFEEVVIEPIAGRYVRLSKNLFANMLMFSCRRPRIGA
jgi:SAM-dependent methyltransferase